MSKAHVNVGTHDSGSPTESVICLASGPRDEGNLQLLMIEPCLPMHLHSPPSAPPAAFVVGCVRERDSAMTRNGARDSTERCYSARGRVAVDTAHHWSLAFGKTLPDHLWGTIAATLFRPPSVNQSLPSGPSAIPPRSALALAAEYMVKAPEVVTLPTLPLLFSVNQRFRRVRR